MSAIANIIEVSEANFDNDVIEQSRQVPVVVDFWAPWCGPCRMLSPLLDRLASEPGSNFVLAKVNVDENPNLSMRFHVQGIPAVKGFRDGRVVAEFVGAQPEPIVRKFLKKVAPNASDQERQTAGELLAEGQWTEAEAAFRRLLDQQPDNRTAAIGLARALLAQGNGCQAESYVSAVQEGPELAQAEKLLPLAQYLCQSEQMAKTEDISEVEAQYWQAAHLFSRDNHAAAMDGILEVLRQDKRFHNDEARKVMIGIFELFGEEHPLTRQYRPELALVLF